MLRAALRRLPSSRERAHLAKERRRLLALISIGGVCAEIGVWQGDFAAQILETCRPLKLHLIDPWRYTPAYERSFYGRSRDSQTTLDGIHDSVQERFGSAIAAGVVEVHRQTSEAAALLFPDGYFDFVYVDGNHTYEFVRRDLEVYRPKLKPDAVLAGDDYALRGWWEWGVKRAVDEAVREHAYEPIWLGRQFVLRLPP
jgi:SAM-dependent methyltransferase